MRSRQCLSPGLGVQIAKLMGEQCLPTSRVLQEERRSSSELHTQRDHKLEGEKLPEVPTENPSCQVGFLE